MTIQINDVDEKLVNSAIATANISVLIEARNILVDKLNGSKGTRKPYNMLDIAFYKAIKEEAKNIDV